MSIWCYTLNIVVVLLQLLILFCNLICLSEKKTHVKCSIIIIKPTQILYNLLRYISPIYLTYVPATLRATIKETAWSRPLLRKLKLNVLHMKKGKSVPLQAWSGPECSRKFRFPVFMTMAQNAGKFVSLTHRPPLPPGNTPGAHFC